MMRGKEREVEGRDEEEGRREKWRGEMRKTEGGKSGGER